MDFNSNKFSIQCWIQNIYEIEIQKSITEIDCYFSSFDAIESEERKIIKNFIQSLSLNIQTYGSRIYSIIVRISKREISDDLLN